jgi:predicted phosphoribosyltransferase
VGVRFADRAAAGRELGRTLARSYRGAQCVVLALPRGGVPVATEVAAALGAPWDVFAVRQLGVPGRPERAFGAVASGGVRVLNRDVVARTGLGRAEIEAIAGAEVQELRAREQRYRAARPFPPIAGRTAILVDDGIATGASIRAAVDGVRALDPDRVVVAAPVAPRLTVRELAAIADAVVVLAAPREFTAVGRYYADFRQVSDQDVATSLDGR